MDYSVTLLAFVSSGLLMTFSVAYFSGSPHKQGAPDQTHPPIPPGSPSYSHITIKQQKSKGDLDFAIKPYGPIQQL